MSVESIQQGKGIEVVVENKVIEKNFIVVLNPSLYGFTLIELMVVLAVISVFAGIAVPGYNSMVVNNSLREAAADSVHMFQKARSLARSHNTAVTLSFTKDSNEIKIFSADGSLARQNGDNFQIEKMPDSITASTDNVFRFSPLGTVDVTEKVVIVLNSDSQSASTSITIENTLGQLTVNDIEFTHE